MTMSFGSRHKQAPERGCWSHRSVALCVLWLMLRMAWGQQDQGEFRIVQVGGSSGGGGGSGPTSASTSSDCEPTVTCGCILPTAYWTVQEAYDSVAVPPRGNGTSAAEPLTIYLEDCSQSGVTRRQTLSNASNVVFQASAALILKFQQSRMAFLEVNHCTNITINGLEFQMGNSLGVAVQILHSQQVLVDQCTYTGIGLNAHGLALHDSSMVLIRQNSFTGQTPLPRSTALNASYTSAAVVIRFDTPATHSPGDNGAGTGGSGVGGGATVAEADWTAQLNGSDVTMVSSNISGCGAQNRTGVYYRRFPELQDIGQATAMHIHFSPASANRRVLLMDSLIEKNRSPYDPAVVVIFQDGALLNQVTFAGCAFNQNLGYMGGALFVRFLNEGSNTVVVSASPRRECIFHGNRAQLEASVARVAFSGLVGGVPGAPARLELSDKFIMRDCTITSSVTGFILATMPGTIVITTLLETASQLVGNLQYQAEISGCSFRRNSAQSGSGIYVQLSSLKLNNCTFDSNRESALAMLSSLVHMEGDMLFSNNMARTGGAISVVDESEITVAENSTIRFVSNSASLQGGAVYVDRLSSTLSLVEMVESRWKLGLSEKTCFLKTPPATTVHHSLSSMQNASGTRLLFLNNLAPIGYNVFAPSVIPCSSEPYLPNVTAQTNSSIGGVTQVVSVAAAAFWIIFRRASCDCLKPFLNGTTLVYEHGCHRDNIAQDIAKHGLNSSADDDFKKHFVREVTSRFVPGAYNIPNIDVLTVPWSASLLFWWVPRIDPFSTSREQYSSFGVFPVAQQQLQTSFSSNITLYPAPGEEFSLDVDVLDFQLSLVYTVVRVRVTSLNNDVLLRYGGLQYGNKGFALFQSWQTLRGLSLAGAVGARGIINLEMEGQVSDIFLQTGIPFRLRPCFTGFEPRQLMLNPFGAIEYVKNFTIARPIPSRNEPDTRNINALVCQCSAGSSQPGIRRCGDNGYDVTIKSAYWAGNPAITGSVNKESPFREDDFAHYEQLLVERMQNFSSGYCWDQFCSYDTDLADWSLRTVNPCPPGLNRGGALCSLCLDGYTRVPFDNFKCYPACENPGREQTKFFILLFTGCFVMVAIAILFSMGSSATFDTWILHWQITTVIDARGYGTILRHSIPDGLVESFFCISSDLSAPAQVAAQLLLPLFVLLIVLLIIRIFRTFKFGMRILINFPVLPTLWGCILASYCTIIFVALQLLSCVPFQDRVTFYLDATQICFGPGHVEFGVLAIFLLFIILVPAPIVAYRYRSTPRIKPLIDPYMHTLAEKRRWWISVNFLRRLVFISLAILIPQPLPRRITVFIALHCLFYLHVLAQPYRNALDNAFEALVLANATIVAGLSAAGEAASIRVAVVITFLWPQVAGVLITLYKRRQAIKRHWEKLVAWVSSKKQRKSESKQEDEDGMSSSVREPFLSEDLSPSATMPAMNSSERTRVGSLTSTSTSL